MRRMNQTLTRLSIMGLASLMALAVSAANAQEVVAQVIGKTN